MFYSLSNRQNLFFTFQREGKSHALFHPWTCDCNWRAATDLRRRRNRGGGGRRESTGAFKKPVKAAATALGADAPATAEALQTQIASFEKTIPSLKPEEHSEQWLKLLEAYSR